MTARAWNSDLLLVYKHSKSRVLGERENACSNTYSLEVSVRNARSGALYEPFLQDEL